VEAVEVFQTLPEEVLEVPVQEDLELHFQVVQKLH
jgi:hypothetical protein